MYSLIQMLVNIKNSQSIHLISAYCRKSKLCVKVLEKLLHLGFIRGYKEKNSLEMEILLKYHQNIPSIINIQMISTLRKKVFISYKGLLRLKKYQFKIYILFTTKGILTLEEAILHRVGGKIIFLVE